MSPKISTAYIAVAGPGTRLGKITKAVPKPFFLLGDKPIIEFIVEELNLAGIKHVHFIVSDTNQMIFKTYFNNKSDGMNFYYIPELDPRGPGYAMRHIISTCRDDACLFFSGDRIIFEKRKSGEINFEAAQNMIEIYVAKRAKNIVLAEQNIQQRKSKHTIVDNHSHWRKNWSTFKFSSTDIYTRSQKIPKNKKSYVTCGRCLVSLASLEEVDFEEISEVKTEVQVMDIISNIAEKSVGNVVLCLDKNLECVDLGTWDKYLTRNYAVLKRKLEVSR